MRRAISDIKLNQILRLWSHWLVPLLSFCKRYFKENGYSQHDIGQKTKIVSSLYGIIEGQHSIDAFKCLIGNRQARNNIFWFVTVLSGGSTHEKYRQLTRFQKHKRSPKYHILLSFIEELNNHRKDHKIISISCSNPSHEIVQKFYFGQYKVSKTMTVISSVTVRLPPNIIGTIGEIINSEHTNLCQSETTSTSMYHSTDPTSPQLEDIRLCINMPKIHSTYKRFSLMKAKKEGYN